MSTLFVILLGIVGAVAAVLFLLKQRAEKALAGELQRAAAEIERLTAETGMAAKTAQAFIDQRSVELEAEARRVREHYESESRKIIEDVHSDLAKARKELEPLRALAALQQSEAEVRAALSSALAEAAALRTEANFAMDQARREALDERKQGHQRARELYDQAEALMAQATRDAGRIVSDAEARAQQIGGDAYTALRDKQMLEQAVKAIHNVIEGYGDRYIIPTHSLLDELASGFGHTSAGEALRAAREQSRRMVAEGLASECDYSEANRRETAIRFVTDAFNGRVDAILSRVKHDNFGTLEQEIRDAFSLVNLNGEAFRNARVLPAYRDARVAELRWAVVVQELKLKEREEQRRIQEQIREEEKARRDYERALQEAAREEETIRKAMERARDEAAHASAQDKVRFEAQLAELNQRLAEAEAKNQRAISMAQQTRSGHVYIISNIGSFGEDVLKVGMTRRLNPDDRIWELSDASVPFDFDVHAMIKCDDAPALERLLHQRFDDLRVNKVNYRKEFFRVPIQRLRDFVTERKMEATFTMAADAREYRETLAYEKMTPEDREKYHVRGSDEDSDE
jgi:DNA repair exonuclease SbcCD ATPase subunit